MLFFAVVQHNTVFSLNMGIGIHFQTSGEVLNSQVLAETKITKKPLQGW